MHYDFIEIGTSDFNTEIEVADEWARGISVEPILEYLSKLPAKPLVHRLLAAISDSDGITYIHHVSEADIERLELPWWVRGCSSIGKPHPTVEKLLEGKTSCVKQSTVQVYGVNSLLSMFQVTSINMLKIDTEGHDCVILNAYIKEIDKGAAKAKRIKFESNSLANQDEVTSIIDALKLRGYTLRHRGSDVVMTCD